MWPLLTTVHDHPLTGLISSETKMKLKRRVLPGFAGPGLGARRPGLCAAYRRCAICRIFPVSRAGLLHLSHYHTR